jgi:hypothetical protein
MSLPENSVSQAHALFAQAQEMILLTKVIPRGAYRGSGITPRSRTERWKRLAAPRLTAVPAKISHLALRQRLERRSRTTPAQPQTQEGTCRAIIISLYSGSRICILRIITNGDSFLQKGQKREAPTVSLSPFAWTLMHPRLPLPLLLVEDGSMMTSEEERDTGWPATKRMSCPNPQRRGAEEERR